MTVKVNIKMTTKHEFKGTAYRQGDKLSVTPEEANTMFRIGVAEKDLGEEEIIAESNGSIKIK